MEEGPYGWEAIHRLFQIPLPPHSRSEPEKQPNQAASRRRGTKRRNPTGSPYQNSPLNPTSFRREPVPEPPAAAADDNDDEQPSITLEEWWLEKAKGHEDKISVGGHYYKGDEAYEYVAGRIAMRHGPHVLEDGDGVIVYNLGFFIRDRTLVNGFTEEACERFSQGFPYWWDDWKSEYPNLMSSEKVSQPRSPTNSGFCDDSNVSLASTAEATTDNGCQNTTMTLMVPQPLHDKGNPHLTRRQAKLLLSLPESQNLELSLPESRDIQVSLPESLDLQQTTSGGVVVSTQGMKDAEFLKDHRKKCTGSSRKQTIKKSAASNHGIDRKAPSASKGLCSNDKNYVGKDNSSHTHNGHQKTPVASPKRRGRPKKHKHASEDAPNLFSSDVQSSMKGEEPAGTSRKRKQASTTTIWQPLYGNPHVTRQKSKLLSVSSPESLNLQRTRSGRVVVPTLDIGCQSIVYNQDGSIFGISGHDAMPLKVLTPPMPFGRSPSKKQKR